MDSRPRVLEIDAATRTALDRSRLGSLPEARRAAILLDAVSLRLPPGTLLRRAGDVGAHVELVVAGLLRIYVLAPDGRSLTVRYCRPGDLVGAVSLFREPYVMSGSIQAVEEAVVLSLRPGLVRQLADTDLAVARALLDELSDRVVTFVAEIPDNAFATVRQRVARHLLDLATDWSHGSLPMARISQQELADAVGTAREVVVRVLRDLRADGTVSTGRDGIVIRAPARLYAERFASVDGTEPGPKGAGRRSDGAPNPPPVARSAAPPADRGPGAPPVRAAGSGNLARRPRGDGPSTQVAGE